MTQRQTTGIVGGGAAGLAAAVAAAACGDRVTVLERMDRVGKKLLATGNGRGNLMNGGEPRYPGGDSFAKQVLSLCGPDELRRFWSDLGLCLSEESDGRFYPLTRQASTVLDALRFRLERDGTAIETGISATALHWDNPGWCVRTDRGDRRFGRVIVCGGGMAQPKLGSNGSTYSLLESLGHTLVKPRPALTPVETDTAPIRGLSGIRVRCGVRVMRKDLCLHEERGELLFTDTGISGICAMQCARWARKGFEISIDLADGWADGEDRSLLSELDTRRSRIWKGQPAERLLTGLLPTRLAERVMSAAGLRVRDRSAESLTDAELRTLAAVLRDFRLTILGVKGFDAAQVTAGGIATDDFDPFTMESHLARGVHAAGEVLDVDGDCGGFNLMFAFSSGILAGLNGRRKEWRRDRI